MFPPFDQFLAHHYCVQLLNEIERGNAVLKRITKESEERKNQGVMLGTLVCWNKKEQKREVLAAVSGISLELELNKQLSSQFVVVPPVVDSKKIEAALEKNDAEIHSLTAKINELKKKNEDGGGESGFVAAQSGLAALDLLDLLKKQREKLTTESLKNVFSLYSFCTLDKSYISLNSIIEKNGGKLPPTGTGDCCAPKLLSFAFERDLVPVSMDEIFYGKDTLKKQNGKSYAPCDERCGIILPYILKSEILYRDSSIVVINKSAGLLSVPGRTEDKKDCAESRIKMLFPYSCTVEQCAVHRLDMETSGILVLAFTKEAHRNLEKQFEKGFVHKKYTALLEGILEKAEGLNAPKKGEKSGIMTLPFRLDVENRPHQIYDNINGKKGITEWQNEGCVTYFNPDTKTAKKVTKITFIPHTGRTHQLRLAASDFHGFGLPIIGDSLYGTKSEGQRLMLHAEEITFFHPVSGQLLHFECKAPF